MYLEDSNENRKQLYRIYNEVSKELFGTGTISLKVEITVDTITFRSKHQRAQRSISLEKEAPWLKQEVDFHLSNIFKLKVKEKLETSLGLNVNAVFRDYDPVTQMAFTNVVLNDKS